MGFFGGPNKALTNMGFKDQIWSQNWEERKTWRKKKKRRRGMRDQASQGMELWIFGMETILIMELNGSMEL